MVSRDIWYWQATNSSPTSQLNQGPWSFNSPGRILQILASGMLGQVSSIYAGNYQPEDDIIWGVQWGASGYTPVDILTSSFTDQWFIRQGLISEDTQKFWTPSGNDVSVNSIRVIKCNVRAQYPIGAGNVDMYLSIGSTFGASNTDYYTAGTISAIWS